jgi:hypothetical protein
MKQSMHSKEPYENHLLKLSMGEPPLVQRAVPRVSKIILMLIWHISKTRPQQTIEACVKRVEHSTRIGRAWLKWFHANDIPGHKANCPYFIGAVKLTQDLSKGAPPPSFIIVCPLVFIFLSYTIIVIHIIVAIAVI